MSNAIDRALENATVTPKEESKAPTQTEKVGLETTPEIVSAFFRLNPNEISSEEQNKIKDIYDYVSNDAKSEMDMVMKLKDIRYKLGAPVLGTSYVDHVHKYVKIRKAISSSEAKLKAMEE